MGGRYGRGKDQDRISGSLCLRLRVFRSFRGGITNTSLKVKMFNLIGRVETGILELAVAEIFFGIYSTKGVDFLLTQCILSSSRSLLEIVLIIMVALPLLKKRDVEKSAPEKPGTVFIYPFFSQATHNTKHPHVLPTFNTCPLVAQYRSLPFQHRHLRSMTRPLDLRHPS